LLVAPAALGLMAPMAANAADLNVDGVSDYAVNGEQVTSISQFSDVYPTDWAYQALTALAERYGCVSIDAATNKVMTRYEAAALLNSCLENVSEMTDDVRRLISEFGPELAVLQGRLDGLEAKVGALGSSEFSTTTKLSGVSTWTIGASSFGGDSTTAKAADKATGATTFNYDLKLDLDTSFNGDDLLKTRLRSGNFANSGFGGVNAYSGLSTQEYASSTSDQIQVDRLWYQFPLGEFTATVGPKVRQDDMLAVWPSAYPADTTTDFFTYAGTPGVYNLATGGGGGLSWTNDKWSVSANYISTNADNANPNTGGGLMTDAAGSNTTVQIAYAEDLWGLAAAYARVSSDATTSAPGLAASNATPLAVELQGMGSTDAYGVSAWWTPEETGAIPSISAGFGVNTHNDDDDTNTTYDSATTQSWYVGVQWPDAFAEGNTFGAALGQATKVTDVDKDTGADSFGNDDNMMYEVFYQIAVSDNITVTPAIFYVDDLRLNDDNKDFNQFGGLIKTTFTF